MEKLRALTMEDLIEDICTLSARIRRLEIAVMFALFFGAMGLALAISLARFAL